LVRVRAAIIAAAIWLMACAPQLAVPAPGMAGVAGTVRLLPHEGAPSHPDSGGYGDRRLHDVRFVDYSNPDSCVVYLDVAGQPGGLARLAVEESLSGVRLSPRFAVVGVAGEVVVLNRAPRAVVVSLPAVDRVERIEAGAELRLRAERAGPLEVYLLGVDEPARVWVSPGPWARPDERGRFTLTDLPPGRFTLRAWHPRLPAAAAVVELRPNAIAHTDFELGVGRSGGGDDAH
jgi:hypothetical protein